MAEDKFASYPHAPGNPATTIIEIDPNDATDLPEVSAALNVATPGTVRVTTKAGTTGTIFIAAGVVFPIRVTRVWETGTSATGICALV